MCEPAAQLDEVPIAAANAMIAEAESPVIYFGGGVAIARAENALREFARRLRKNVRGIDLACRFGGEEFVVVMPETDMAVAAVVAERIRRRIAGEPFAIGGGSAAIDVTISIGLAALAGVEDNAARILKRADQALYRAKRDGRNRVVADAA